MVVDVTRVETFPVDNNVAAHRGLHAARTDKSGVLLLEGCHRVGGALQNVAQRLRLLRC